MYAVERLPTLGKRLDERFSLFSSSSESLCSKYQRNKITIACQQAKDKSLLQVYNPALISQGRCDST